MLCGAHFHRRNGVGASKTTIVVCWMPMRADSLLFASFVMRAISCGKRPPLVSQSTIQSAPTFSAACHVAKAYSGSFL